MAQSAIYVVNNSVQDVAAGGIINLGTIIRRFGRNLNLSGNGIQVAGEGYYDINASITVSPSTDGEVTVTGYKDGVAIPGLIATETAAAAGDYINLSLVGLIREACYCCESLSSLTFVLSGLNASVTNVAVVVKKL